MKRGVRVAVVVAVVVALVLRVAAALLLGPHIDEAESVLAARIVATTGVPVLPSGVVFLQGLTLSYLLPWFDRATDPYDFALLRMFSVIAGTAAVAAVWPLARAVGASRAVAALAVVALATDGTSIEWSAHVRPYALLQLLTIVLLTAWFQLMSARSTSRAVVFGVVFAVGVSTHVGIALVLPALVVLSWATHGRALAGPRRDLGLALLSTLVPLGVFFLLNSHFGVTTRGGDAGGPGFIGDHVLALASIFHPDLDPWRNLFQRSGARDFVLLLAPFLTAVLLLRRQGDATMFRVLFVYALPCMAVVELTTEAQPRYLLHVHPLSWILFGMGLEEVWRMDGPYRRRWRALALVTGWIAGVHFVDGARMRLIRTEIDPDYPRALRWLESFHQPGEPVLSAMTSVTWFSSIHQADIRFLAGPADAPRTKRYTREHPDGRITDYWSGVAAITSTVALCEDLRARPGTWLVLDTERLRSDWAFGGAMEAVIVGATTVEHSEADVGVYRSLPESAWSEKAAAACLEANEPAEPAEGT